MFHLQFSTANAAFDPETGPETARILRDVAERVEQGATTGRIRDINGNRIGQWSIEQEGY